MDQPKQYYMLLRLTERRNSMTEAVQNIVTVATPIVIALIGFLVGVVNVAKELHKIFEKSNLETIKKDIQDNQDKITASIQEVIDLYKETIKDNAELKKENKELKQLLTKVKEE